MLGTEVRLLIALCLLLVVGLLLLLAEHLLHLALSLRVVVQLFDLRWRERAAQRRLLSQVLG